MGYQTALHGSLGLPCGLYQFMSLTEGTALLFGSELVHFDYDEYDLQQALKIITHLQFVCLPACCKTFSTKCSTLIFYTICT